MAVKLQEEHVSMPFLTGSLLQQEFIASQNEIKCFYALSNGQSVATNKKEEVPLGILFLCPF